MTSTKQSSSELQLSLCHTLCRVTLTAYRPCYTSFSCRIGFGFASNFQKQNSLRSGKRHRSANCDKKTTTASAVKARPIQVTGSKGIHGGVFSEFALACIFALAKKLPQCLAAQHQAKWQRLIPEEIAGKTLGIVGLGTVGSELAAKAKALGLRVIATKRTLTPKPPTVDELGPPEFLAALLPQSDFVVLSLASVPSTENILREQELRSMRKSAYLINLTGGKTIEEQLLIRALKQRWIAGAALDAFARQPLPADSELWRLPNVIISPRIGGVTEQKWAPLLPIFTENLKRFVAGEPLSNVVNKELGY